MGTHIHCGKKKKMAVRQRRAHEERILEKTRENSVEECKQMPKKIQPKKNIPRFTR